MVLSSPNTKILRIISSTIALSFVLSKIDLKSWRDFSLDLIISSTPLISSSDLINPFANKYSVIFFFVTFRLDSTKSL